MPDVSVNSPVSCAGMARRLIVRLVMVGAWLLLIDAVVFVVKSRWPGSKIAAIARNQESLESRIARQFDSDGRPIGGDGALVHAGWVDPTRSNYSWPASAMPAGLRITIYGMSFSSDVGRELRAIDPTLTVRLIDAPTSTSSHSLAMAGVDPRPGQVAVLGILTSQVSKEGGMLGAHISAGNLAPYTSPAMVEQPDGTWRRLPPVVGTAAEFGPAIVAGGEPWESFRSQLGEHDPLYSRFVFDRSWLDHSFVAGLVRRAWDRSVEERAEELQWTADEQGEPRGIRLVREVVTRFAELARARGECPVVLVIRTFRDPRGVCLPLKDLGQQLGVPVLCTQEIVDADDSANFKPDRHYTDDASRRIAQSLLEVIRQACEATGTDAG